MLELVQKIGGLPNKHGPTYGLYRFGHKVTLLFITPVRGMHVNTWGVEY